MNQIDPHDKKALDETILAAKQGDQNAFEQLLEQYRPLISSLVKSTVSEYNLSSPDYEDLYQEAILLFFRALTKFDNAQEAVAFGLFAKICIRNGLRTQARKLQSRLPILPLEESTDETDAAGDSLVSRIIEQENYRMLCDSVHATLTPYENRVWWLYLSGRTAKEIAALLEKDEKSVQNAVFRIRRKLRNVIPHP